MVCAAGPTAHATSLSCSWRALRPCCRLASERRVHARVGRAHKLFVQVRDDDAGGGPDEGRLLRCVTENISAGGLAVTVLEQMAPGTRVELWINVHDKEARFLLSGQVRWCTPSSHEGLHDAGIELDHASSEELAEWAAMWSDPDA